ncbi:hypothetical protein [Deinococcus peraridilitoris]|uniref:Uncharacterized protein n=1 Tax=Deinococcus peraridilitoris (strain DSM 19664 / LMG 22246 / CIP 109416 / KR-200) TaxID=937777 RepID=K9ZZD0_DEIPD|nr:hypothetical protein [Deinococcus peraridilitoris]AFZ67003.1 hypothetical protein Deipe_1462 [Deinococcus peraridilitoris DSM 19664]
MTRSERLAERERILLAYDRGQLTAVNAALQLADVDGTPIQNLIWVLNAPWGRQPLRGVHDETLPPHP